MQHVVLLLGNGNTVKGYFPPPFWLVLGVSKINCPKDEDHYLALITEPYWPKYRTLFDDGEKLFARLPKGYTEIPLYEVKKIEVMMPENALYAESHNTLLPLE